MMNTFLTSLLFASLVDIGACDSNTCQGDETNFTRPVLVFEEEARTSTMYRWQKRIPDCSGWHRAWSWATHKCDEQNVVVSYIHVSYVTVSKTANVVECCPGYTNTSGDCVQGCAKGTYGANCSLNCSCANNSTLNQCDQDTGYCLCPPGYYGLNCTHECGKGYYGSNCSYACTCANNATCNKQNGKCNCTETPGWTGNACEKHCTNDAFGHDCAFNCTCNENQTCDHVNGTCTCKEGHTGQNCSEECAHMKYGANCAKECTCQKNTTQSCDPKNGTCTCNPGYTGIFCMRECDLGYYGDDCNGNCTDYCIGTKYCHHETGKCICLGKKGENCTEECESGTYGEDCNSTCTCTCSHDQKCDPLSGKCYTGSTGECSKEADSNDKNMGKADFLQTNKLPIAFGVVGLVLLIAVIITVCCCYYKRRSCWSAVKQADGEKRERITSVVVENPGYIASLADVDDDGEIISVGPETVKDHQESKLAYSIKKTVADDKVDRKSDSTAINRHIKKEALEVKLDKGLKDCEGAIHQRKENNAYLDDTSDKINEKSNVDMKHNEELEGNYAIGDPDDDAGESGVIYEDADVSSDDDTRDNQNPAGSENDYDYGYHDKSPLQTMSAYNTFEEIRNMRIVSEAGDNINDQEEDYDHLEMSVRKESLKTTDQEAYSTTKRVRMMSERGHLRGGTSDVEEDETYNTLESEQKNIGRFSHPDYNRVTIADKITVEADNFVTESQRTSIKREIVGNGKQPIVQNKLSAVQVQPVGPLAEQTVQSDDDENYPFCAIQEHAEKEETENLYENCSDDENDDTPVKVINAVANNRSIIDEAMANDKGTISEKVNESSDTETSHIETVVTPPKPTVENLNKGDPLTKDNVAKLQTNVKTHNLETGNSLQKNGQTGIQKTKDRKLHDYEDFKLQF